MPWTLQSTPSCFSCWVIAHKSKTLNCCPDLDLAGANLVWLYGDQPFDRLHPAVYQQHIGDCPPSGPTGQFDLIA